MSCLFYLAIMSFYFCALRDLSASSAVARIPNSEFCFSSAAFSFFRLKRLSSLDFNCYQAPNPNSDPIAPPTYPPPSTLNPQPFPPLDLCHREVATSVSFEQGGSPSQEHFTSVAHNHSIDGDI